jgi:drug/metabolite transporter (DMT)-like permease
MLRLALWMTGALLSFSAAALSVRELAKSISVFEIMSFRSGTGLLFLAALAAARPQLWRSLAPRSMELHALRNSVHFACQICWASALTMLPLATVFAIEFTMPAWVALLAVSFLGERMTINRAGSVVLCFFGVLVVIRPGLANFQPAALLVVVSAIAMAITLITTKKLTATQSTFAILFWMNLMQLPMNLVGSDSSWIFKVNSSMYLPLLGMAVTGLSTHWCLTSAFRYGDATIVVPLDFLRVPLIALVGWSLYGEPLDAFVFCGAGLIITGYFGTCARSRNKPHPRAHDAQFAFAPDALTTLAHFSVSSASSLPNSAGEPGSTLPPVSARRAVILASV